MSITIKSVSYEDAKGIILENVEANGVTADFTIIEENNEISSGTPYFYISNNSESLFQNAPLQTAIEKTAFEYIANSDSPVVSDVVKDYVNEVLHNVEELTSLIEHSNYKEFSYRTGEDDYINITPCSYADNKSIESIEYFLTVDSRVNSASTIYQLASNITNIEAREKWLEQDKKELQDFYDDKIASFIQKPREKWTDEQEEDFDIFSDWHKDAYGYRPRSNENECEKSLETKYKRASVERD